MKKKLIIKAAVLAVAALVLLAVGLAILHNRDASEHADTRSESPEGFGELKTVTWEGKTYREKPAVTTILFVGTDRHGDPDATGSKTYRRGSPADFLLLVAIDHTSKQIHQLQIDRDTMTDVVVLGTFGNEAGTRIMQICLSHYYGDTLEANAKYTVRAVENLLDGLEIDGYYVIDYSTVPVLNDALGGVTVTVPDDMTSVNPDWKKGATITLHGQDAETFVRTRATIGSGTNEERMTRQGEYMRKAVQQMNRKIREDLDFGEALLKSLESMSTTNMTTKWMADELSKAYDYEILPIDHPAGTYSIGADGYVEFHMQEGETVKWILGHLFVPQ